METVLYRQIERYLVWIALIVLAAYCLLADHYFKDQIDELRSEEKQECIKLKDIVRRVDAIDAHHAEVEKVRLNGKQVYGVPIK